MGIKVALLNAVALTVAVGLFAWSNLQPEKVIVVAADQDSYEVIRQGPGWPVAAYRNHGTGVRAGDLLTDQFPEGNRQARADVWLANGPFGVLLVAALVANLGWIKRSW